MARAPAAPTNPVLPEHLLAFDRYLVKWQALLGLTDWRIVRSPKPTKNMADVEIHHKDRLARIRVGADFGAATPVTPASIENTVVHELLHVALCELVHRTAYGITDDDAFASAEHRVVNMMAALLLNLDNEKGG